MRLYSDTLHHFSYLIEIMISIVYYFHSVYLYSFYTVDVHALYTSEVAFDYFFPEVSESVTIASADKPVPG